MDAQANISLPNAQNIVSQLVDIAKANNAMDVIGSSTGWRWQEGLISRMPKTRTVAAILTKAFRSDDPCVWLSYVEGDLNWFIKVNFTTSLKGDRLSTYVIKNSYEAYFLTSILSNGSTREEIIYGLCYFRYAASLEDEIEFYQEIDNYKLIECYRSWAQRKFEDYVIKFEPSLNGERYHLPGHVVINSESYMRYYSELSSLRNKVVGFNSVYDMWNTLTFEVSDEEHISIEIEIKNFVSNLRNKYFINKKDQIDSSHGKKLRTYLFNTLTLPKEGEVLR